MSRRPLAFSPAPAPEYSDALESLRERSESPDVLARIAEAGAAKREARGGYVKRITVEVSDEEHENFVEHARRARLTLREVARVALAPLLRKP